MLAVSQVLNKIIQQKDYSIIKKNALDKSYFHGFENEFTFIEEHYKKYGNIPDIETFIEKFPNFQLYEVNETDEYLLDKLYEEYGYLKFTPIIPKLAELVTVDSRDAYEYLLSEMKNIKPHVVCTGTDIIKEAQERYEKYVNKAKEGDNATIKTGLPELDDIFGGWEYGDELVTVVARTNMGKCLEKGTKILTLDGVKNIEDIKIGDKVKSTYSYNTVIQLHSGKSKGYKIITDYNTYTVSENHILTLYHIPTKQIVDIMIEDLLKKDLKDYKGIRFVKGCLAHVSELLIQPVAEIEYYGFACDGDHRFLLADGTLTHNSWLLMKFLVEAWKQGKRVGLYSGEMSHIKLGYRFDALFNHFSNRCLSIGAQTAGYKEYIDDLTKKDNPFIIATQKDFGGRPTVPKFREFIESNNLDIFGVDQYSLVDDARASMRDPTRIQMAHISEDLFLLSTEYKIPILGLAQANREGAKKEAENDAPGLENIKECDDIAHNSSKCIGMKQSSFGLVLDIIKNREGRVGDKLLYSWDIDTGHFSYIPSAGDAAKPEIRQQVQQQTKQQFVQNTSINPF